MYKKLLLIKACAPLALCVFLTACVTAPAAPSLVKPPDGRPTCATPAECNALVDRAKSFLLEHVPGSKAKKHPRCLFCEGGVVASISATDNVNPALTTMTVVNLRLPSFEGGRYLDAEVAVMRMYPFWATNNQEQADALRDSLYEKLRSQTPAAASFGT